MKNFYEIKKILLKKIYSFLLVTQINIRYIFT